MVVSISKHRVIFQPEGKRVKVKEGQTILEAAQAGGVDLVSICGGVASCGKCKIIIDEKFEVSPIAKEEKEKLSNDEINQGIRLACLTKIYGDVIVKVPKFSRTGKQRLQIEGIDTPIKLDPSIKKFYLEINKPTLEDPKPDVDRIKEELFTKYKQSNLQIDFNLLKNISKILRESDWKVTIVIWENEIITVEPNDTTNRIFGYAVDIGTTKLAGYLLDLTTGKVIAAGSLMNPQIPYGEDIITRMNFLDRDKLQAVVVEGINQILEKLKYKSGVKREEIYEMTVVGNSVMHHLFFDLNPKFLGLAPYTPVIQKSIVINADEIGININTNGKVYFLPIIAGYVGADNVAAILATEIYKSDKICMVLDIGTNTEVVLGNKEKLLACSCASGPAFEGAQIRFGMRAASGAIEKVEIGTNLNLNYETIDNEPPKGICGSAMVDLLAEMLKSSIIDVTGKFNKNIKDPKIRAINQTKELVVATKEKSGTNEDITFSQMDVRQIILAKAAMRTGIEILLKNYAIKSEHIEKFFIAGAFGNYIDKKNARIIGMYPEIGLDRVVFVGNAAGTGARMCLVSKKAKNIAEEISKKVTYIELGADRDFQNYFLNANFLPYADLEKHPEISKMLKKVGNFPEKPPHIFK